MAIKNPGDEGNVPLMPGISSLWAALAAIGNFLLKMVTFGKYGHQRKDEDAKRRDEGTKIELTMINPMYDDERMHPPATNRSQRTTSREIDGELVNENGVVPFPNSEGSPDETGLFGGSSSSRAGKRS